MNLKHWLLLLMPAFLFGCKETQNYKQAAHIDEMYYRSIKSFFDDQWNTRRENPVVLMRLFTFNGQKDSAVVKLDSALWHSLSAIFSEADLKDSTKWDQYAAQVFTDSQNEITHLYYHTDNPDLFVQNEVLTVDMYTEKAKSIYIETREHKKDFIRTQKLHYIPDHLFRIIEYEKSFVSSEKNSTLEYKYFTGSTDE
jgi:hypothetical protein